MPSSDRTPDEAERRTPAVPEQRDSTGEPDEAPDATGDGARDSGGGDATASGVTSTDSDEESGVSGGTAEDTGGTGSARDTEDAEDSAEDTADTAEDTAETAAEDTAGSGDGDPAPRTARRRARLAAAVGIVGELLITAGIILGLFVAYSLWWTNVIANREAARDSEAVRERWEQADDDGDDATPPPEFDPEDGIGFLHVPAMSNDEILVKEGVSLDVLNGGVAGYYDTPVESAMPWEEEGNFSVAAHRDGHGAKFHNIDDIEEGDPIVFETRNNWYIYRVFAILPETSRYNTGVLEPIPEESGADEPGRYITLTTCTPVFTSEYRYIVWGELERVEPVNAQRTPPPELAGTS
ncbi:class E sortase [Streptomyces sp. 7-21]|nr:class E sortase [Streptomyces sp. 7-21]